MTSPLPYLFEQNKELLNTLKFAQDVFETHQTIDLHFDLSNVKNLYQSINDSVGFEFHRHQSFIMKGLDKVKRGEQYNNETFPISPNVAYMLSQMATYFEIPVPAWLPETFAVDQKNGTHRHLYLFNWSTVNIASIPRHLDNWFSLKLQGELKSRTKLPQNTEWTDTLSLAKQNIQASKVQTKTAPPATTEKQATPKTNVGAEITDITSRHAATPAVTNTVHDEVAHGLFVAAKYRAKVADAKKRKLDFNLTIEDMSNLVKDKVCYFTQEPLATKLDKIEEAYRPDELPDNYLTIDRLDPMKGYIKGNVVACSRKINELKDDMSHEQFNKLLALRTLAADSGLSTTELQAIFA